MSWLRGVKISGHFRAPDFSVDFVPPQGGFQHLMLVGPNGSGKTTILDGIAARVIDAVSGARTSLQLQFTTETTWTAVVSQAGFSSGNFVWAHIRPGRHTPMAPVNGPTRLNWTPLGQGATRANLLHQHLVNQQVQARLAKPDDPEGYAEVMAWFARLEASLSTLFGVKIGLRFHRKTYSVTFVEPSGLEYGFNELPSGFSAVLQVLAELIFRVDMAEKPPTSGVVLIDEVDAFLHPALQERVLPVLTTLYPQLQFIVATHSPAVAASLDNATVVNLATGGSLPSSTLRGTPYGKLLTSLFGIETDVDLGTTERLRQLHRMHANAGRTPEESAEMVALARELQNTDDPIVWTVLTSVFSES